MLRIYEGLAAARQALALEASARDADGVEEAPEQTAEEQLPVAPPPDEALREAARAAMAAGEGVFAFPTSAPTFALASHAEQVVSCAAHCAPKVHPLSTETSQLLYSAETCCPSFVLTCAVCVLC